MQYLYLSLAIFAEVIATTLLKQSNGFKIFFPTLTSLLCYALSFYCMSICMRSMSSGIIYAIWSGVGLVLISIVAYFLYNQHLDFAAVLGMSLIILGIIIIQLYSKTV